MSKSRSSSPTSSSSSVLSSETYPTSTSHNPSLKDTESLYHHVPGENVIEDFDTENQSHSPSSQSNIPLSAFPSTISSSSSALNAAQAALTPSHASMLPTSQSLLTNTASLDAIEAELTAALTANARSLGRQKRASSAAERSPRNSATSPQNTAKAFPRIPGASSIPLRASSSDDAHISAADASFDTSNIPDKATIDAYISNTATPIRSSHTKAKKNGHASTVSAATTHSTTQHAFQHHLSRDSPQAVEAAHSTSEGLGHRGGSLSVGKTSIGKPNPSPFTLFSEVRDPLSEMRLQPISDKLLSTATTTNTLLTTLQSIHNANIQRQSSINQLNMQLHSHHLRAQMHNFMKLQTLQQSVTRTDREIEMGKVLLGKIGKCVQDQNQALKQVDGKVLEVQQDMKKQALILENAEKQLQEATRELESLRNAWKEEEESIITFKNDTKREIEEYSSVVDQQREQMALYAEKVELYQETLQQCRDELTNYHDKVRQQQQIIRRMDEGRLKTDFAVDSALVFAAYVIIHKFFLIKWVNQTFSKTFLRLYTTLDGSSLKWTKRTFKKRVKWFYWLLVFIEGMLLFKRMRYWAIKRGAHSGKGDIPEYLELGISKLFGYIGISQSEVPEKPSSGSSSDIVKGDGAPETLFGKIVGTSIAIVASGFRMIGDVFNSIDGLLGSSDGDGQENAAAVSSPTPAAASSHTSAAAADSASSSGSTPVNASVVGSLPSSSSKLPSDMVAAQHLHRRTGVAVDKASLHAGTGYSQPATQPQAQDAASNTRSTGSRDEMRNFSTPRKLAPPSDIPGTFSPFR